MKKIDLKVLLPNIITLSGLSFGLSSIRFALEEDFNLAILCILFAAVCDVLDGLLARHLKSESDLGAQLDSLSDFLSFGIAPGILIYMSIFNQESSIGAFACLIFIIFSCLRLALFNINNSDLAPKLNIFFKGVPTPAGAILILIPVTHSFIGFDWWTNYQNLLAFYTLTIAFLLISNIPTYSLKNSSFQLERAQSFRILILFFTLVLLLINFLWIVISVLAIAYLLSMPFSINSFRKSKKSSLI